MRASIFPIFMLAQLKKKGKGEMYEKSNTKKECTAKLCYEIVLVVGCRLDSQEVMHYYL